MRTFLAEGYKGRLIQPHQHTRVVLARVSKCHGAVDRNAVGLRNEAHRRLSTAPAQDILESNPELTGSECEAGEHQELGEVTPGDVIILGPVYRKVVTPSRLLGLRFAIGSHGRLFAA
jgi:hypothetical protein